MTDVGRGGIAVGKIIKLPTKLQKWLSHTRARAERLGLDRLVLSRPVTAEMILSVYKGDGSRPKSRF